MQQAFGLSIPQTLDDVCDPTRLALVVYDMQVGIVKQIENGPQITDRVLQVLEAARKAGIRVFFTRHMSLPKELMGVSQFRTAMAWQRAKSPDEVEPWSKKGVFTSFDPPGAVSSTASTVNPSGAVVGAYTDSGGVTHGYLLDKKGTFTTIDFPGSIFTFAGGNNPEGDVIGAYTDTANVTHAFLLSNGVFTSFDPPGAIFSDAAGINPGGVIVGIYVDSANAEHGFIRTP